MRSTAIAPLFSALSVVLAAAGPTRAQPPLVVLAKPLAEHEEGMSELAGLRELRDGRVVVSVTGEGRLMVLDFRTQGATDAAKQGSGPLEFRIAGPLFALGDSVGMMDAGLRRLLIVGPDGKPTRTSAIGGTGTDIMAFVRIGRIVAADRAGRIYSESRGMTMVPGKMPTMSDTVALVRWSKLGEKGDTLATRFEHTEMPGMAGDEKKGIKLTLKMDVLTPRDGWDVFPDGRVTTVRIGNYQVESIDPSGKTTIGGRVANEPVPLTAQDRQRLVKQTREAYELGLKLGMSMAGSAAQGKMPKIDFDVQEPTEWPKNRPIFFGVFAATDGSTWVARSMPGLGGPSDYDVLGRDGKIVKRVRFPERVTVIGFGKGVVYTVRRDEDDLRYVQKYKLP
jgi:hypothetical protein